MRLPVIVMLLFGLAGGANAAEVLIKGEISFDASGVVSVAECGTQRIVVLGTFAPEDYVVMVQRYQALSDRGKLPVVVVVRGTLTAEGDAEKRWSLENPKIGDMSTGGCEAAPSQ